MRPVLGIVDDGVCELGRKREGLEDCLDDKDISDSRFKAKWVRRSAEWINGLDARGERRKKVGECH